MSLRVYMYEINFIPSNVNCYSLNKAYIDLQR